MLTTTIKNSFVNRDINNILKLTIELVLSDDDVAIFSKQFSQTHNPANSISIARDELLKKIQKEINNYKSNKLALNSKAFTDVINYIKTNLEV